MWTEQVGSGEEEKGRMEVLHRPLVEEGPKMEVVEEGVIMDISRRKRQL